MSLVTRASIWIPTETPGPWTVHAGAGRRTLSAQSEIERLGDHAVTPFERPLLALAQAALAGDIEAKAAATKDLAAVLGPTMALAGLMGAKRLLMEIDARQAGHRAQAAAANPTTPVIPKVPFREAIDQILSADDRLEYTGEEVARAYSEENVFAMAYSASEVVTARVHDILTRQLQVGLDRATTIERIARILREPGAMHDAASARAQEDIEGFTRAYATTVYRTNLNRAYTAGRFAQASDPDVTDYVLGFRYSTAGDVDVRANHAAAEGMLGATADPVWQTMSTPAGYLCRCALEPAIREDFEAAGMIDQHGRIRAARIPAGAHPDRNFGMGRPDLVLHGVR